MDDVFEKPFILYAEDDTDDFDILEDALSQLTTKYKLLHVKNGVELMSLMETAEQRPCLVVLDLNMPLMDGKEALLWLKKSKFKDIPVMIFTTSSREQDMQLCKSHQCTFFRKPTLYRDLLHIVQTMLQICAR